MFEKNSFVFESVEKGKIRGRYTIFGKKPDKIWEFSNNKSYIYNKNKKITLKGRPKKNIEKIIEQFKFKLPKGLPNICSLLADTQFPVFCCLINIYLAVFCWKRQT